MILVDEYDRAPMDAHASDPAGAAGDVQRAVWALLKGLLAQLKALATDREVRYYITGIFTVPGLQLSIFKRARRPDTHTRRSSRARSVSPRPTCAPA